MPIPRSVPRSAFMRNVFNPGARRIAGKLPLMGVVIHKGRKSGTTFRTPVLAFQQPSGYAIALTYGRGTDWERNVLAAGGCSMESRGTTTAMTNPHILTGPEAMNALPAVLRPVMKLMRVDNVMVLDREGDTVASR